MKTKFTAFLFLICTIFFTTLAFGSQGKPTNVKEVRILVPDWNDSDMQDSNRKMREICFNIIDLINITQKKALSEQGYDVTVLMNKNRNDVDVDIDINLSITFSDKGPLVSYVSTLKFRKAAIEELGKKVHANYRNSDTFKILSRHRTALVLSSGTYPLSNGPKDIASSVLNFTMMSYRSFYEGY